MNSKLFHILLADDDRDDCYLFEKALKEIPIASRLTTVYDGQELMNHLEKNTEKLPGILFLDLSMPRKTGFESLAEIKENEKLKHLPVVMLSTSFPRDIYYERDMISTLMKLGAHKFIRKPGNFEQLKQAIHQALIDVANG